MLAGIRSLRTFLERIAVGSAANAGARVLQWLETKLRRSPVYRLADSEYGGPRLREETAVTSCGWKGGDQWRFAAGVKLVTAADATSGRGWLEAAELIAAANAAK